MIRRRVLAASLATLGLLGASCGSDGDSGAADTTTAGSTETTAAASTETTAAASTDTGDDMAEGSDMAMPGEGVTVHMAKADWTTEDPNAYIARALLQELGYEVTDPKEIELGPSNAFTAMAQGDADFWVNSWFPAHNSWLENDLPDGTIVGDHIETVGEMMMAGGLQGYLISKDFADEFGIKSLDDLNNNPDAIAAYDASDPEPGNGKADIYGCQESYTCDDIITAQIAFSGWENIGQVIAGYDAMFAEAVTKADAGEPMVAYTWTPSSYITQLRPGDNVYWLTVEDVVDDSNPSGVDGGEKFDQRPGVAGIGPDQCPGSVDGQCQLGWVAADVQVSGNKDFLDSNPAAKALLEQFQLGVLEVSLMNVDMGNGVDAEELAATWIADNQDTVNTWLDAARAAA